jgi:hypothetical protein
MNGAWRVEMTEIEHCVGCKPDGYIYSLNKEAVETLAKERAAKLWAGVTISAGKSEFVPISAEFHAELMETVCITTATGKKKGDLTIIG